MTNTDILCPDGQPLKLIQLSHASGLKLDLIDWGATWVSCRMPVAGVERETLLGHATLAGYFSEQGYLGATVGRFANRVGNARIERDGRVFQLTPNQGVHQLHGGPDGFDRRRWNILEQSAEHVLLGIESPDGDQGYPGNLTATVCYRLEDGLRVSMAYTATVDAPCPVNLTNHAYFNLDGAATDVRQHVLSIAAHDYLPIDKDSIPLGQLAPVAGTGFDFNAPKKIGADFLVDAQQKTALGYDHAFQLDPSCRGLKAVAATLVSGDGQLAMDLLTTKPAVQFYSGNYLAGISARDGGTYSAHQGLALETEFLPDCPNHPEWPESNCWLLPGETYRQTTVLVFRPA
ncbi:galactose-1-epimerase [Rhodoferax sp.]|uniref:galactose-1-epimerase n=1 Tax=Rhodoferax sp. TaxID=50421 RepID=UPI00283D2A1D|nr:galactose-1-epimerase [Rhodoferax sp.]MDR3371121.1 galactose-1-epimerase [Rhodoferax sp.]